MKISGVDRLDPNTRYKQNRISGVDKLDPNTRYKQISISDQNLNSNKWKSRVAWRYFNCLIINHWFFLQPQGHIVLFCFITIYTSNNPRFATRSKVRFFITVLYLQKAFSSTAYNSLVQNLLPTELPNPKLWNIWIQSHVNLMLFAALCNTRRCQMIMISLVLKCCV